MPYASQLCDWQGTKGSQISSGISWCSLWFCFARSFVLAAPARTTWSCCQTTSDVANHVLEKLVFKPTSYHMHTWPWHTITRTPGGRNWIYISICLVWTSSVTKNTIHLINFLSSQNPFGLHISSMSGIEKRYWREELESHAQDDPHKDGHRKHWEVQHPLCVISVNAPRWGPRWWFTKVVDLGGGPFLAISVLLATLKCLIFLGENIHLIQVQSSIDHFQTRTFWHATASNRLR